MGFTSVLVVLQVFLCRQLPQILSRLSFAFLTRTYRTGVNYQKRGLFEAFKENWSTFVRTRTYTLTIFRTLATRDMQAGFIPEGSQYWGILKKALNMFDEKMAIYEQTFNLPLLLLGKAYSLMAKSQFMHLLSICYIQEQDDMYMLLFTNMQYIMYNGANIRKLFTQLQSFLLQIMLKI